MENIDLKRNYSSKITKREIKNSLISQKAAEEGMVLLKNDGTLPLDKNIKIALYGAGARKTIKGGWGSGEVNERKSISIEKGLEEKGYKITTKRWLNDYDKIYSRELENWKQKSKEFLNEHKNQYVMEAVPFIMPSGRKITNKDIKDSNTEVAVYVISRISGEGADRKNKKGDYSLFDTEIENLKRLVENYKKVILIINSGGIIDTSFLNEIKSINSIIYMSQAGSNGGCAITNILCGEVTPSGKLSDTWAIDYNDYPTSNEKDLVNVKYKESIFVGYRYFDTFNIEPMFEFGYGLSYTQFSINIKEVSLEKDKIKLKINVKNIGKKYKGKEVIQIYISGSDKDINREYQRLVGFEKTKLLKPEEEQEIIHYVDIKNMKTYKEEIASWILTKGKYTVRIGNSSKNTKIVSFININEDIVVQKVKNICKLKENIEELTPKGLKKDEKVNVPIFTLNKNDIQIEECNLQNGENIINYNKYNENENRHNKDENIRQEDKENNEDDKNNKYHNIIKIVNNLSLEELYNVVCGAHETKKRKIKFYKGEVPGSAGETTSELKEKYNIDNLIFADGPAGIKLKKAYTKDGKKVYQYCTAMPIGTLLAQTWNTDILKEVGSVVGEEMQEFGISIWLAPGMNIHRTPLCGRNFEYFSEDPLLTGIIAGNIVLGLQSRNGVFATLKHFICNNKENNRIISNSIVSEKALREIYLRGFEIAVKLSNPISIMSSYNKVNGIPTSNSYDLCTEVLRNEWGFKGLVMTDWFSQTIGKAYINKAIEAGNDLIMPGHIIDVERLKKYYEQGELNIEELKKCATNILNVIYRVNK